MNKNKQLGLAIKGLKSNGLYLDLNAPQSHFRVIKRFNQKKVLDYNLKLITLPPDKANSMKYAVNNNNQQQAQNQNQVPSAVCVIPA